MVPPKKMRNPVSAQWCRGKKCGILFLINGVSTEATESCFWSMVPGRRCPDPHSWLVLSGEAMCMPIWNGVRASMNMRVHKIPRMAVSKLYQHGGWLRWVPGGLGRQARVLAGSAGSPSVCGQSFGVHPAGPEVPLVPGVGISAVVCFWSGDGDVRRPGQP